VAGTALRGRLNWLIADVAAVVDETTGVRSLVLDCPGWPGHLPGQHVDVRLTADDGYQAQRSYSIATPADGRRVTLTVERIADGEVSPYLTDELRVGDRLELRGPIGGYFVWEPSRGGPLRLVGGGSGVVPLMAMIRARAAASAAAPVRLLLSSRLWDEVIYREELEGLVQGGAGIEVVHTLTRAQPPGWGGYRRRIDREMLAEVSWPPEERLLAYVCGPTGLVEAGATALVELGHDPARIKTERFGPTGGPPWGRFPRRRQRPRRAHDRRLRTRDDRRARVLRRLRGDQRARRADRLHAGPRRRLALPRLRSGHAGGGQRADGGAGQLRGPALGRARRGLSRRRGERRALTRGGGPPAD
jgi:ferredoxin-NADP reductase